MESIGYSLIKIGAQNLRFFLFIIHCFGVPHDKLGLVFLPVVHNRHNISIIFIYEGINSISWLKVYFTSGVAWAKAKSSDYPLILKIILNEPVIKYIITTNLMIRHFWSQVMNSNIAISTFEAKVGLAEVREFKIQTFY